jgi:hypothetical protein
VKQYYYKIHRIGVHTCHLRDKPETNKMVSDTPRTDAAYTASTGAGIYELFQESKDIERELKAANDRIKQLEDWKESALAVEREWNPNALATMLGGQPGESQRKVIQRKVPLLLDRIKRLEAAGDAMAAWLSDPRNLGDDPFMASQWHKAKEAKP